MSPEDELQHDIFTVQTDESAEKCQWHDAQLEEKKKNISGGPHV